MKRTHLAVILVPLALALQSCGGDDSKTSSAPAAGTSPPAATERPQGDTGSGGQAKEESTPTGSGGSSSADADRAAKQPDSGETETSGSQAPTAPRPNRKPAKPKTPEQHIAALSPSERRKLHEDLYQQGKQTCYSFGPKEIAKSYNLPNSDPETIARLYARAYEAVTPTLILPYEQGCLAGFRKFARKPPKL